jgi:hypothetical protein
MLIQSKSLTSNKLACTAPCKNLFAKLNFLQGHLFDNINNNNNNDLIYFKELLNTQFKNTSMF